MGVNDSSEQLAACKAWCVRLEGELESVRRDEREKCAQIADDMEPDRAAYNEVVRSFGQGYADGLGNAAIAIAAAIRSQTTEEEN